MTRYKGNRSTPKMDFSLKNSGVYPRIPGCQKQKKMSLAVTEYASLVPVTLKLWLYFVTKLFWYPTLLGLFIAITCTFTLTLEMELFMYFCE